MCQKGGGSCAARPRGASRLSLPDEAAVTVTAAIEGTDLPSSFTGGSADSVAIPSRAAQIPRADIPLTFPLLKTDGAPARSPRPCCLSLFQCQHARYQGGSDQPRATVRLCSARRRLQDLCLLCVLYLPHHQSTELREWRPQQLAPQRWRTVDSSTLAQLLAIDRRADSDARRRASRRRADISQKIPSRLFVSTAAIFVRIASIV